MSEYGQWDSTLTFIFAMIGVAIGLGNKQVWNIAPDCSTMHNIRMVLWCGKGCTGFK